MRFLVLTVLCALSAVGAVEAGTGQDARWRQHAENVRIVRDNWGIAHVYGKSDGDAVFGMIYAQASDCSSIRAACGKAIAAARPGSRH